MMKKAAVHNLGCKVNSYELDVMVQELCHAGYQMVPFEEKADLYLVNTCSVTSIADRKSRQMLHRAKKMNPGALVVAAGCYAQAKGEKLEKDPAIDLVIGNNRKKDLISILETFQKAEETETVHESKQEMYRLDIGKTKEYEELKIDRTEEHTRAFIKVQDGCNQFCTYCIIPYARGRVRSRKMQDVLSEVERLSGTGCK